MAGLTPWALWMRAMAERASWMCEWPLCGEVADVSRQIGEEWTDRISLCAKHADEARKGAW